MCFPRRAFRISTEQQVITKPVGMGITRRPPQGQNGSDGRGDIHTNAIGFIIPPLSHTPADAVPGSYLERMNGSPGVTDVKPAAAVSYVISYVGDRDELRRR